MTDRTHEFNLTITPNIPPWHWDKITLATIESIITKSHSSNMISLSDFWCEGSLDHISNDFSDPIHVNGIDLIREILSKNIQVINSRIVVVTTNELNNEVSITVEILDSSVIIIYTDSYHLLHLFLESYVAENSR